MKASLLPPFPEAMGPAGAGLGSKVPHSAGHHHRMAAGRSSSSSAAAAAAHTTLVPYPDAVTPLLPPGLAERIATLPWKPVLQRIPGLWLLSLVPFAVWGPLYAPWTFAAYYTVLHLLFFLNNARSAYGVSVAFHQAKATTLTNWKAKYCQDTGMVNGSDSRHDMPYDHVLHLIILPNYKEELETLEETLDVLASHPAAIHSYKVCLAMEESEKEAVSKAHLLLARYGQQFFDITFTLHPVGRRGEIRGKSSNVAWAARQMSLASPTTRHDHEIITVMDADTCFAADYFAAITYYYATATAEERQRIMFAPCTVFDRNAKSVPVFVRVTDIFWSIGVISNLYPSSPIKIPCSAYSVSMNLAVAVDFWDAGPEAIGEDLHMYLKCFFATNGKVRVQSIFSPASQCNVEYEGKGLDRLRGGLRARYSQAKRHLWGSLDTGYAIRHVVLHTLGYRGPVVDYKQGEASRTIDWPVMGELLRRLLEAHILMGHMFFLMTLAWFMLPVPSTFSYPVASYLFSFISSDPVHPVVLLALRASFWIRLACLLPNVMMIHYYEKYHMWVAKDRWILPTGLYGKRVDSSCDLPVAEEQESRSLGKLPSLRSYRSASDLWDWLVIPVAGFMFYVCPQFHAQLSQLFTDSLEYKVAAKPTSRKPVAMESVRVDGVGAKGDGDASRSQRNSSAISLGSVSSASTLHMPLLSPSPSTSSLSGCEHDKASIASSKGDEGYFEELTDSESLYAPSGSMSPTTRR